MSMREQADCIITVAGQGSLAMLPTLAPFLLSTGARSGNLDNEGLKLNTTELTCVTKPKWHLLETHRGEAAKRVWV